jgi:hypothetical protein
LCGHRVWFAPFGRFGSRLVFFCLDSLKRRPVLLARCMR